jgi:hypothetical protein
MALGDTPNFRASGLILWFSASWRLIALTSEIDSLEVAEDFGFFW